MGGGCCRLILRHGCLFLPRCPWGRRGGTRCSVQRFDLWGNSPLLESRQPQCLCLRDSRVSRAWRWSLVRRAVQAAGILSAKTSVSIVHPTLRGQEAALPWVSMPVFLFLCTPLAPQVLQYPPWSSQAPTALEGERRKLAPCYILAQCSCGHQYGRAKGFVLQNGVSRAPRPFAEEHPCALHPWGHAQLPTAASWGRCGSPFPVPRLPKSLETHQLLSKPCNMGPPGEGRSRGKPCTLLPGVVNLPGEGRKRHLVKRRRDDPNHTLGPRGLQEMTRFLRRAPARWGNEALLG